MRLRRPHVRHRHRPARQLVAALLGAAALTAVATPAARAYHTPQQRLTAHGAETLGGGTWDLGLWRVGWGVHDRVDLSTVWPALAIGAPNLHLKWRFWSNPRWAVAVRAGLFWMKLDRMLGTPEDSESTAALFVFPLEAAATWRFHPRWSLSVEGIYTTVGVRGRFEEADFEGVAALPNFQLTSTLEWRASRVTALYLHLRVLAYQGEPSAQATITADVDEFTTVEVHGAAAVDVDYIEAPVVSAVVGAHWSWQHFNLRLGLGYGYWSVPGINLVVPFPTPIPELDLFWRF